MANARKLTHDTIGLLLSNDEATGLYSLLHAHVGSGVLPEIRESLAPLCKMDHSLFMSGSGFVRERKNKGEIE